MQRRLDYAEKPECAAMNPNDSLTHDPFTPSLPERISWPHRPATFLRTALMTSALLITATAGAEELGRLFFTPEQRAQLESGQQPKVDTPEIPSTLSVSGIVQKHGGERTVWINGVPQIAGKSDEHAPESVPIAVPGQSQPVRIKVGQEVLLRPAAQKATGQDSTMPAPQKQPASDD